MGLSCSREDLTTLQGVIRSSIQGLLWTEGGAKVPPVDLWKLLGGPLLEAQQRCGDAFSDSVLWSLRQFLNSADPTSSLLFLEACSEVLNGRSPEELLLGERRALWRDVEQYLQGALNEQELNVLQEMIAKGAIEGYEVLTSTFVEQPTFNQEPLKVLPFNVHSGWAQTAEVDLPIELPSVRFVVADETVSEEEQVRFLQQLSRTGSPIVLLCYRMDEALAQDLGRGWRDGWSKIIPCAAVDGSFSEEFRVNVLADTAWITGSSLCSYVSRTGLRDLQKGSREISKAFPFVTVGGSYVKFLAHASKAGCRLRAGQLLSRLEAPDESAELILQRAAYINGAEVQLLLPEGEKNITPSALDLGVSVYKTFMDGAAIWGEERRAVPYYFALMAIKHASALKGLVEVENLEFLG